MTNEWYRFVDTKKNIFRKQHKVSVMKHLLFYQIVNFTIDNFVTNNLLFEILIYNEFDYGFEVENYDYFYAGIRNFSYKNVESSRIYIRLR